MTRRRCGKLLGNMDRRLEFAKHIRGNESPSGAIAATEAGSMVSFAPDEWVVSGTVEVAKKVDIVGNSGLFTCPPGALSANTDPLIHIKADSVTLRGLNIKSEDNAGIGILVEANKVLVIECVIEGFHTAIKVKNGAFARVHDNLISDSTNYGIYVENGSGCSLENNVITTAPATKGLFMDGDTENSLVTGNVMPTANIEYTNTGKSNQPDNATKAGYTNVANSITVN